MPQFCGIMAFFGYESGWFGVLYPAGCRTKWYALCMTTHTQSATPTINAANQATSSGDIQMDFHARLNEAVGTVSYRKLGGLTDTHPETVRRYMQGQAPSATFLTNLCRVLGISGEWLLTGKGPMKCAQIRSHALNQADPSELMTAVANTLTDVCDRMDRLERFMQMLETRVRAGEVVKNVQTDTPELSQKSDRIVSTQSKAIENEGDHERAGQAIEPKPAAKPKLPKAKSNSAQRIRDAIAKRPS